MRSDMITFKPQNAKILVNVMITPDGRVLESRHRHDFVTHKDENGKLYMLDGGHDYVRCSDHSDQKMITFTTEDPHELVRQWWSWGTYGKNGDEPFKLVTLRYMSNAHIEAILETQSHITPEVRFLLIEELDYRKTNSIHIEDKE